MDELDSPQQLELLSSVDRLLKGASFSNMNGQHVVNVARVILGFERFVEAVQAGILVISEAPTDASS